MRMALLTAVLLLGGCTTPSPTLDTITWVRQLRPLLAENGLLADRVLEAASEVHDGAASPATATLAWEGEIAPLARHLHDQAALVQAPAPHLADHDELVAIWGARAEGYTLVAEALGRGDEARWKRGRALSDKAKLDEEAWFKDVNTRLAPQGVDLDQYP